MHQYDLVTLDLQLPDMHGIDIVEYLHQQETSAPTGHAPPAIIIITGAIDEGRARLAALAERDNVFWLQKPLVNRQLETVIAQALARLAARTPGGLQ